MEMIALVTALVVMFGVVIFSRNIVRLKKKKVVVGSQWKLSQDPFTNDSVCVLDIKDGWVKYQYSWGATGSMELSVFVWVYKYPVVEK